jgi:pyrroloquinoline quinone biosynthesis protein B
MIPALEARLRGAAVALFDGTVFHDDEMIRAGVGPKTGRRMGHMAMAGPDGSMAAFATLSVRRKVYVHINNTNPVWDPTSPERRAVEDAGWEVGFDGMEIVP